jgi:hypothetical protein
MKGQNTFCLNCGVSFTKKRKNHKFCRTACRVAHHREKNNIPEPDFLKKDSVSSNIKGIEPKEKKQTKHSFPTPTIRFRHPIKDIRELKHRRNYWQNVLIDLDNGIFPTGLLVGYLFGAALSEEAPLLTAVIGATIGNTFDQRKIENLKREAINNINLLDQAIDRLQTTEYKIKTLQKQNKISKPQGKQKVMDILSASEYKKMNIPVLNFTKEFAYLMGKPSINFCAFVHGKPGNGKSTFAVKFADYFERNHGKVIYLASEQHGLNNSFQDLLKKHSTSDFKVHLHANKLKSSDIKDLAKKYKLVILDSINHMKITPEELENIREEAKRTAFLSVMQSTKDGSFKGSQDFAHNSDIMIEMVNMEARQYKSRFAPKADIKII